MAIETVSKEAANLGTWIGTAVTAITAYLCIDKFRRSGPIKDMGDRMDRIEKNVEDKFTDLTNQRVRDVDAIKTEITMLKIDMATLATETKNQTGLLDRIWNRLDKGK